MLMKRLLITSGTLGAFAAIPSPAMAAADAGWYIGISAGQSTAHDIDQDELDDIVILAFSVAGAPVLSGSSTLDDSDTSFALNAGYRFNPYIAVEGGYINLGSADYVSQGFVNPPGPVASAAANYSVSFESSGFTLGGIANVPIGKKFDLHTRIGLFFAKVEIDQRAAVAGAGSATDKFSENSQEFFYGIGAGLKLGEHWHLGLDWIRYNDVGDEDTTGESNIDNLSVSATFHF